MKNGELMERIRNHGSRFEKFSDVFCTLSTDLVVQDVSPSVEAITGKKPSEFIGKSLRELTAQMPETFDLIIADLRKIQDGENPPPLVCELFSKSGDPIYCEVKSYPVHSEGKPDLIFSVMRDITACKRTEGGRKKTEDALGESEEYFRVLIENASDVIAILDIHGNVLFESPSHERVLGYSGRGFIGENVFEYMHPDDQERISRQFIELVEKPGGMGSVNFRFKHADGSWRYLEGSGRNLLNTPVVRGIVVNYRDVTERKNAEQDLKKSEARFRNLLEGLELIPVQGYDQKRHVIYWNRASEEVYGYSRDEALGRPLENLIIPEYMREPVVRGVDNWLAGGESIPAGEIVLRDKAGNDVPVYSSHVMHVTASGVREMYCVDVDLRKLRFTEAEGELLKHTIEQVAEVIVITDSHGIIQYVNPAFEAVTGYTRDEAIGQNPRVLKSGEQDDKFYREMWEIIASGKIWKGRFINRKKDGVLYTESATISPVLDSAGDVSNYVAVKRDITEYLQREKEKKEIEEQFRQTQKVEAIGRLAGGIAHDLNNLLSPILGYGEMLLGEFSQEDYRREQVEQIVKAGFWARDLVRQLLAFSRKQTLDYKPLDINKVIENFEKLIRRTIRENIQIDVNLDPTIPLVNADIGQIEQVIMNLAVNAEDAMPEGGRLLIRTSVTETDKVCGSECPNTESCRYVTMEVSDTGSGISSEVISQIFEPFFSTKGEKGTGLGLSTVFGIVKQHEGDIKVFSEPGDGTIFRIYLPASTETVAVKKETPKKAVESLSGSDTILLVEDNELVRDLALSILKMQGYKVIQAEDGKAALSALEKHSGKVDLLLTDVIMPDMNGKELFRRIHNDYPDVSVLYMSGYSSDVIGNRGILEVGTAFIQKPFTVQGLLIKIRESLSKG